MNDKTETKLMLIGMSLIVTAPIIGGFILDHDGTQTTYVFMIPFIITLVGTGLLCMMFRRTNFD